MTNDRGSVRPGCRARPAALVCLLVLGAVALHAPGSPRAEDARRLIPGAAIAAAIVPVAAADLGPGTLGGRDAVVRLEKTQMARDLFAVDRERVAALRELRAMGDAFGLGPEVAAATDAEANALAIEIAALERDLAAFRAAPEAAAQDPWARRWGIEITEMRLKKLKSRADAMSGQVKGWIGERLASVERLLGRAGADTGELLARLDDDSSEADTSAQGGPLEPFAGDPMEFAAFGPFEGVPPASALSEEVQRLAATNRLLATLPLMAPLDDARMTSRYGVRRDPITGRRAMHSGIDFAAPKGTPAHVTAPGTVLRAERSGAYGLLVEVDHGLGVVTRYAHMDEIVVVPGERVEEGQQVGVIGSTGRSTGRHLHYEILIDGRHINPKGFLQAGTKLAATMLGG